MPKYRKKPVVVEAEQWEGDIESQERIKVLCDGLAYDFEIDEVEPDELLIASDKGNLKVQLGDWVAKYENGYIAVHSNEYFKDKFAIINQ